MRINTTVVDVLCEQVKDVICIYLFGSYAEDRYRKESDIDIAVLAEKKLNNIKRWKISGVLSDKLKRDIDLIDLRVASTVMKAQITAKGKCIYESDKNKRDVFEMYSLSDYVRLNEERKEIVERVKREGTVYAR